jgi:outer membrane protein
MRMGFRVIGFASWAMVWVVFACGNKATAQRSFNSLEELWLYADSHNINLTIAQFELEKSAQSKKQAYSTLLPQATANATYTDNIQQQTTLIPAQLFGGLPGTYRALQFGTQFVYSGNIAAQWNILNLQNWLGAKIAKQTEEMYRDSLATVRVSVYQQIATQYYSYLLMNEAARLADLSASIADTVYELTANKFQQGTVDQASVDVAKLNYERAQQSQITSDFQMATARNSLKALLGLSVADSLQLTGLLEGGLEADNEEDFQQDPAIRLASERTRISLSQYRQANSAFAPTFSLLYNYTTQRYDSKFEPFTDATGTRAWFPSQYWGIQGSLPLFTGGNRYFQSKRYRIAYEESKALYEYTVRQSAINDENIRLNYRKATAAIVKAQDVMNLSLDNYKHVSNRYEAGVAPLADRLNAFRDFINYQNDYLNALSDLFVQLYQVKIRQQSFSK